MGLIVTFTVPKVIHEMGEAQKKAVGKETITALHDALYAGWQDGTLNSSTTYQQLGDYLASKLNITRDCPAGRPVNDCVTTHPHFASTGHRTLVLPNGAWLCLWSTINAGGFANFLFLIDYNGSNLPNIEPAFGGGAATTSDVIVLFFNYTGQRITTVPSRHGNYFHSGALVSDHWNNQRNLVYNYWMGLD
jgi:hypothetical protein